MALITEGGDPSFQGQSHFYNNIEGPYRIYSIHETDRSNENVETKSILQDFRCQMLMTSTCVNVLLLFFQPKLS